MLLSSRGSRRHFWKRGSKTPPNRTPSLQPGVVGVLFAWDSHVLDTCSRLIEEHYGEAVYKDGRSGRLAETERSEKS